MSRAFSRRRLTAVDHDQAEYSSRETEAPTTKNARTVWTIAQTPFPDAHFATFPSKLVEPCVLAGCPRGGIVLDPFAGSGTTLAVALEHGRQAIGIELNPDYAVMIERRLSRVQYPLPEVV
jgi:DNA modification methylase